MMWKENSISKRAAGEGATDIGGGAGCSGTQVEPKMNLNEKGLGVFLHNNFEP